MPPESPTAHVIASPVSVLVTTVFVNLIMEFFWTSQRSDQETGFNPPNA